MKKNQSFLMKAVTFVPKWAWNNKFKTLILLGFIWAARKAWVIYTTYIKPFLAMSKMMKGGGGAATDKGGIEHRKMLRRQTQNTTMRLIGTLLSIQDE